MSRESREVYEFGDFRLDVDEHTFAHLDGTRNGNLPEKAFQTLTILVRNQGRLVTKREVMDEVWPDAFVEENNLDKCIHAIRQFLGERPGEHAYIETVRKHGYRFVADVRRVSDGADVAAEQADVAEGESVDASPPTVEPVRTERQRQVRSRILRIGVATLTAIVCVAALAYFFLPYGNRAPEKPSIAVLPVLPIDSSSRDELYEIGIAESLIHRLSSMKDIVVRPISSVRKYSDVSRDPVAAGKEQKADYVVASNYQIADGKIKLTSQLIHVSSGEVHESYKTERDVSDVFAVQDLVAGEISNLMLRKFATTFDTAAVKRGTTNEEAYRIYLHGRALTDQRTAVPALKAIQSFEQAIRLDPHFARAYVGLARAYVASGNQGGGVPREEYAKAREALQKAAEIDGGLAEVHAGLAEAKFYDWDFEGCEPEFGRAIELDPNSDWAHEDYASYLSIRGRFDEAMEHAKIALEINPNSIGANRTYGRVLYLARRYDEAIVHFTRVFEALGVLELWIHTAYEMKGDTAAAYEWFMKGETKDDRKEAFRHAYQTEGWPGVRRRMLQFAREEEDKPSANLYRFARVSAAAGERELAIAYLNKAFDRHNGQLVMLNVEPTFDTIRDDPGFDEIVRRIGLK